MLTLASANEYYSRWHLSTIRIFMTYYSLNIIVTS